MRTIFFISLISVLIVSFFIGYLIKKEKIVLKEIIKTVEFKEECEECEPRILYEPCLLKCPPLPVCPECNAPSLELALEEAQTEIISLLGKIQQLEKENNERIYVCEEQLIICNNVRQNR